MCFGEERRPWKRNGDGCFRASLTGDGGHDHRGTKRYQVVDEPIRDERRGERAAARAAEVSRQQREHCGLEDAGAARHMAQHAERVGQNAGADEWEVRKRRGGGQEDEENRRREIPIKRRQSDLGRRYRGRQVPRDHAPNQIGKHD